MAQKSKKDNDNAAKDLAARSRYPIGLLFQVSTLAGCIAYLIFSVSGGISWMTALYRALVVFIGFAVCIGIVMVTVISVLHRVKMREAQERIKQMHEEQIAEQQLLEAQLRQAQLEREQRAEQFLAIGPGTHE